MKPAPAPHCALAAPLLCMQGMWHCMRLGGGAPLPTLVSLHSLSALPSME